MTSHSVQLTLQYKELHDFQLIKHIMPRKLSSKQLEAIGKEIPEPTNSYIKEITGTIGKSQRKLPISNASCLKNSNFRNKYNVGPTRDSNNLQML